jgi:AcrR family transcriptional regulator
MATQKQRSDATRALLLKAFKESLLKNGYEHTTTQSVLSETQLSKGAMYHHFKSKTDIIEAIYAEESKATIERAIAGAEKGLGPLEQLKRACLTWTELARAPKVSKILFEIGPKALGPEKAKAIEDTYSLHLIESLLRKAVDAGEITDADPKLMAAFLNALVEQTALYDLRTGSTSLQVLDRSIEALFESLKP